MAFRNRRVVNASGAASADKVRSKVTRIVILLIAMLFIVGFLAASIYDRFGSLTISVGPIEDSRYSLALYERSDFVDPAAVISAKTIPNVTNISEDSIDRVNNIEGITYQIYGGQHNGENYFAYTFFVENNGDETFSYRYTLKILDSTNGLEKGIRVRLYINGNYTTYGMYDERLPAHISDFRDAQAVVQDKRDNFTKGEHDRYTVIIWIEGDDLDTTDSMIGGTIKFDMKFEVVS